MKPEIAAEAYHAGRISFDQLVNALVNGGMTRKEAYMHAIIQESAKMQRIAARAKAIVATDHHHWGN